jgi:hypothetical protein
MTTIEQIKSALQAHIAEVEAATPGPWIDDDGHIHSKPLCEKEDKWLRSNSVSGCPETEVAYCCQELPNFDADATFIAHARTMSPAACKCLLLAIEGLESDASYLEKIMHPCDMFANGVEAGKGCFVDQAIRRLESIRQKWHNMTTK